MERSKGKGSLAILLACACNFALLVQSENVAAFGEGTAGCGPFVYWVRGGYYVDNSKLVEGGRELSSYDRGFPFYICRVNYDGNLYIGKFIKSERESEETPSQCWYSDGVSDHVRDRPADYEVLVDHAPFARSRSLAWEEPTQYSNGMGAPLDAFWAGVNQEGRSLFIGQCNIAVFSDEVTTIPGTVTGGSSDGMNVAFDNSSPRCKVDKYLTCLASTLEK